MMYMIERVFQKTYLHPTELRFTLICSKYKRTNIVWWNQYVTVSFSFLLTYFHENVRKKKY